MNNLHQLPTISSLLRYTLPPQLHNVEITRKFENFQIDKRKFLKSANVKCVFTRSLVFTIAPSRQYYPNVIAGITSCQYLPLATRQSVTKLPGCLPFCHLAHL